VASSMTCVDESCQQAGGEAVARLAWFRRELFWCLWRRPDALFELADAVPTAGRAGSLPYLSLEPVFRRGHGMVYQALAEGGIDKEALRDLLVAAGRGTGRRCSRSTPPPTPGRRRRPARTASGTIIAARAAMAVTGRRWPGGRSSGLLRSASRRTRGPRRRTRSASGPGTTRPAGPRSR